jgi:hypothetical protein
MGWQNLLSLYGIGFGPACGRQPRLSRGPLSKRRARRLGGRLPLVDRMHSGSSLAPAQGNRPTANGEFHGFRSGPGDIWHIFMNAAGHEFRKFSASPSRISELLPVSLFCFWVYKSTMVKICSQFSTGKLREKPMIVFDLVHCFRDSYSI